MRHFFNNHPDFSIWLFFTGMAIFILFFISPDSYLSGLQGRVDSAWFFMCGKAWMNGLVPYVDFSDSKGPLLWLIYGVGYLLSHTDYLGVFWISCFWYGLTFFFTYKTAGLFLPERRKAVLCTVLMSLAFFNPWFHNEIRAEDFALLFLMISLYKMCRLVWTETASPKKSFFVLGCCFTALMLIKFNIAAMQAVMVIAALIVSWRKSGLGKSLGICAAGACAVALPFLICFLIQGNLDDFVREYFLRTLETVSDIYGQSSLLDRAEKSGNPLIIYLCEWTCLFNSSKIGALLLFILLGGILFSQQQTSHKYLVLIVSFAVFAITIRHNLNHYFQSCSPFLIFLFISILRNATLESTTVRTALSLLILLVCISTHIFFYNYKNFAFRHTAAQQGYEEMAANVAQKDKPTLINACDHETGIGTRAEALPAGKYWAYQLGSTPAMDAEHKALIRSGKADFVFVRRPWLAEQRDLTISDIEQVGYRVVCVGGELGDSVLLAKME